MAELTPEQAIGELQRLVLQGNPQEKKDALAALGAIAAARQPQSTPADGAPPPASPPPPAPTLGGMIGDAASQVYDRMAPVVGDIGKRAALPTMGQLALGVGGQFVPGLRAIPPRVRESMVSVLGTGANMALGIEPFSWTNLGAAAVTPVAVRGVGRGLAKTAKVARLEEIQETAAAVPDVLRRGVTEPPGPLYARARAANPRITLTATQVAAQEVLEELPDVPGLIPGKLRSIAKELEARGTIGAPTTVGPSSGAADLHGLDNARKAIGALIGTEANDALRGHYRHLYGGILTDMETRALQQGGEGAADLLKAIGLQRRVFAADDLGEIIERALSKPIEGTTNLRKLNVGSVIQAIEYPRGKQQDMLSTFLAQHPQERKEILETLQALSERNVTVTPRSGNYGSGRGLGLGSLTGAVAGLLGFSPAVMATTGAAMTGANYLTSMFLLSPTGRAMIRQMVTNGAESINASALALSLLGQVARSQGAQALQGGVPPMSQVGGSLVPGIQPNARPAPGAVPGP